MEGTSESSFHYRARGTDDPTISGSVDRDFDVDWFATARFRLGYQAYEPLLVYATGGLAYGRLTLKDTDLDPAHYRRYGWTAGLGAELALDHHWSLRTEYLYLAFGKQSRVWSNLPEAETRSSYEMDAHIFRLGVNRRF